MQQQAPQDPQAQIQQQQLQLQAQQADQAAQLKREELAAKERLEAAKLADREQDRQYDFEKEQLRMQQLDTEARLKATLGSGL